MKTPTGCRKRLVLCAYGLTPHGHRALLSFRQVRAESEASCDRIIYAVIHHLNTTGGRHPLAQFTQKA